MGAIGKILGEFDGSSELAQAQREALEALASLGDAKAELFKKQINLLILDAGTGTNKTVPISSVIRSNGFARAYSASEAGNILPALKTAIGGFIEGGADNILNGIFDILAAALELFLGSTQGEELTIEEYFVYATEFAIYRVDTMAWSRTVQAASLKKAMEQATAYAYTLSNVDIEKMKWSDFVAIYSLQLDKITKLTKEERDAAKAAMKDTWNFLQDPETPQVTQEQVSNYASIEAQYQLPLVRLET